MLYVHLPEVQYYIRPFYSLENTKLHQEMNHISRTLGSCITHSGTLIGSIDLPRECYHLFTSFPFQQQRELFSCVSTSTCLSITAQIQLASCNIALFIKHKHTKWIPLVHSPPKSED